MPYPNHLLSILSIAILVLLSQLISTGVATQKAGEALKLWASSIPSIDSETRARLAKETIERINVYENLLKKSQLSSGMVINRSLLYREELDVCDSLLFSSIRVAALLMLNRPADAQKAWSAIERSKKHGAWIRHPRCSRKSLSRDMLTGLLLALIYKPPGVEDHLFQIVQEVDRKSGYFSHGPVYVSYLTPGLGKIIRQLAIHLKMKTEEFPDIIKQGYSTNEFTVIMIEPGYEAHLAALSLWIEIELKNTLKINEKKGYLERIFDFSLGKLTKNDFSSANHAWTARRLFEVDPENLFFTYLRLKTSNAMNPNIASMLLQRLLDMDQFPVDLLPTNCDRKADYLWQRKSQEYHKRSKRCDRQFSGIDFTWMGSILLRELNHSNYITWEQ